MLLLTLRGTPTVYYGEEIGMENVPIPPEFLRDPPAVNQPEIADQVGRDPERTPMQWDASPNAGFTAAGVTPWLPLADDWSTNNVACQEADANSMLNLFRAVTALRRAEPALNQGDYVSLDSGVPDVFAYVRSAPGTDRFLIALNFGASTHVLDISQVGRHAQIALSTGLQRSGAQSVSRLRIEPNEGLLLRLN
jgi:alpha-glucosidase